MSSKTALSQAFDIQHSCARVGFDWESVPPVVDKVLEELREVSDEIAQTKVDPQRVEEELGDLLFAVVNLCRHLEVEPESALLQANEKFSGRFTQVEAFAQLQGQTLESMSMEQKELLWQRAKQATKRNEC
jgi:ATP diphosphatase